MAYIKTTTGGVKWLYHKNSDGTYFVERLGIIPDWEARKKREEFNVQKRGGAATRSLTPINKAYDIFYASYENSGYADNTLRLIRNAIPPFLTTLKRVKDYDRDAIIAWKQKLESQKYASDTIRTQLAFLRRFYYWLQENGYTEEKLFKVKLPKAREDAGRLLKPDEKQAFLSALDPKVKLFAEFIFNTGARLETARLARFEQINRNQKTWTIPKSKRGKNVPVAMSDYLLDLLPDKKEGWVFTSWRHTESPVSKNRLFYYWNKAVKESGIGALRRHDARVTYATYHYKSNRDLKGLMDQLGWRDVKTAMHYTKTISDQQITQANNVRFE